MTDDNWNWSWLVMTWTWGTATFQIIQATDFQHVQLKLFSFFWVKPFIKLFSLCTSLSQPFIRILIRMNIHTAEEGNCWATSLIWTVALAATAVEQSEATGPLGHWANWFGKSSAYTVDIYKSHVWNHMESIELRATRCNEIPVGRVEKLTQDLVYRCLQSFVL